MSCHICFPHHLFYIWVSLKPLEQHPYEYFHSFSPQEKPIYYICCPYFIFRSWVYLKSDPCIAFISFLVKGTNIADICSLLVLYGTVFLCILRYFLCTLRYSCSVISQYMFIRTIALHFCITDWFALFNKYYV